MSGGKVKSPKNIGTGILSDKSIELYRNVEAFVSKHLIDNPDRIFVSRVAMRPCIILASNKLVKTFLNECNEDFYNGLKDFFFGLFGQSVLFTNAADTRELKRLLMPLFNQDAITTYEITLKESLADWTKALEPEPILYNSFKEFSLIYNLKLFLGVDPKNKPEFFQELTDLSTAHWHGIISVPLNVKLSFLASSGYRRAQDAKAKLLDIIEERINSNQVPFLSKLKASGMDMELMKNHLLVFICALIPKASASILSSVIDCSNLWYSNYVDAQTGDIPDESMENVVLECLRLWPPFVGGLRVAEKDTKIGEYQVPKGYGVFYVSMMAHKDPEVFRDPEVFDPDRWLNANKEDRDKIFGFGSGLHKCIGEQFMWRYLVTVAKTFVKSFNWDKEKLDGTRKIKYLPVSRPAELLPIKLSRR